MARRNKQVKEFASIRLVHQHWTHNQDVECANLGSDEELEEQTQGGFAVE